MALTCCQTRLMELLDLVDENDKVIGVTDKPAAHQKRLPHRVVAVYVFNDQGELYVQVHKASGGLLDNSIGGHVIKGEAYDAAAVREAREELGIDQTLTHLANFYSNEGRYLHMFALYECQAAKDWKFMPNNEVEQIVAMKLSAIRKMMKDNPEKFTGGFINTMKQYVALKGLQRPLTMGLRNHAPGNRHDAQT